MAGGSHFSYLSIKLMIWLNGKSDPPHSTWTLPMGKFVHTSPTCRRPHLQVVMKPSELTPLTTVALAELADRAGVPDGVLNVVLGDAPAIGVNEYLALGCGIGVWG